MVSRPATVRQTVALTISRHQNQTKSKLYLGLGLRRNNGKQEGISLSPTRVEPPCPLSEPRTAIDWWTLSIRSTLLLGGALSHWLGETFTQNRLTQPLQNPPSPGDKTFQLTLTLACSLHHLGGWTQPSFLFSCSIPSLAAILADTELSVKARTKPFLVHIPVSTSIAIQLPNQRQAIWARNAYGSSRGPLLDQV